MTTVNQAAKTVTSFPHAREYPGGGITFDIRFVLMATVLVLGLYLDGWAHNHIGDDLDPFFTPWHAIMYGGFGLTAGYMAYHHLRNQSRGHAWGYTLPRGYMLSLIGAIIFAFGGMFDFAWHMVFGLEQGIEAFLSPSHHILIVGMSLIVSGPLRAAWARKTTPSKWAEWLPVVLSVTLLISTITMLMQTMHLLSVPGPYIPTRTGDEKDYVALLSAASVMLQTVIFMGLVLLLIKRWGTSLPLWLFPVMLTVNILLLATQIDFFAILFAVIPASLLIALLYHRLKPATQNIVMLRCFAIAAPVVLYGLTMLMLVVAAPYIDIVIRWRPHVTTGMVAVAGFAGWLTSFLVFSPAFPDEHS